MNHLAADAVSKLFQYADVDMLDDDCQIALVESIVGTAIEYERSREIAINSTQSRDLGQ